MLLREIQVYPTDNNNIEMTENNPNSHLGYIALWKKFLSLYI